MDHFKLTKGDYIAQIVTGAAGSWSRKPYPLEAVTDCARRFQADFGRLFTLKGKDCMVNLWEVPADSPEGSISIGPDGVFLPGGKQAKFLGAITVQLK